MFDKSGDSGLPWGVPASRMLTIPSFMMPAFRYRPYQSQESFILNFLRHPTHQHVVIDLVEKSLQVQVHDPTMALRDVVTCLPNGLQCTTSRAETIAVVREVGVE